MSDDSGKASASDKAKEFFAAEKEMQAWEEVQARRAKEKKGELERQEGESTGEWLARKDVAEEAKRKSG